jgi:ABC-2 type transport system ATP-binding protein
MTLPVEISHLYKAYGAQQVLHDVSLELQPGEIFGLIGLNGVGKTTLIKILLDLAKADKGSAQIFGIESTLAKSRRNVAYLPEKFAPSRHLRGHEFLELSLSYYGKKYDRTRAAAIARLLSLDPAKLEYRISAYSKGMGQKLGLMGALLCDAPLLVLDEPMSGLDPSARIELKELLLQSKHEGKTVFFSSHILSDIEEICDRVGAIHNRLLFFTGTPSGFKETYPAETLEKSFLRAIASVDEKAAA